MALSQDYAALDPELYAAARSARSLNVFANIARN
jgi:hypothetical protein